MRIKSVKIAGFRGFNTECTLSFHDKLTVISAPNSHGKTSISEALEFLLYGSTSKVDKADSKDEYKDSYRNRHFPIDQSAYIEAELEMSSGVMQVLRVELDSKGNAVRYLDSVLVENEWPFELEMINAGRPFILQHALKNLLLVPPVERFKGFAQLLGLDKVDNMSRALISLCTKANATVPPEAVELVEEVNRTEAKVGLIPNLKKVAVGFSDGKKGVDQAYLEIEKYADTLLSVVPVDKETRIKELEKVRSEMAQKVYSGDIEIQQLSLSDQRQISEYRTTLALEAEPNFLGNYAAVCIAGIEARLQMETSLLQIGSKLIEERPEACPLCLQSLDAPRQAEIHKRHADHKADIEKESGRKNAKEQVVRVMKSIRSTLSQHQKILNQPIQGLIVAVKPENEAQVIELVGGVGSEMAKVLNSAALAAGTLQSRLKDSAVEVEHALDSCDGALQSDKAELAQAENLVRVLSAYLGAAGEVLKSIPQLEADMKEPTRIFRKSIDALAGTSEITVLIEVLQKHDQMRRGAAIRKIIDNLRVLKRNVEQTLAETMENMMSKDLTDLVMKWYSRIKTDGDPEVHFSGFSMDRTKSGDFKNGKLAIKAESYGAPLASAVSSLSESKLNALGLCVSIASATRKAGLWDFLLIDDPIQSWDDEHEAQFVGVLRDLIEVEGKQVIVLTHKSDWANRVCDGCRTINGNLYEINSYSKEGPNIEQKEWAVIESRIREVNAIISDTTASFVRVQQAEEELRHIICQLAEKVALQKLGQKRSAHKMSSANVRSILITAKYPVKETDELYAVHSAGENSHHTPDKYRAGVQRVRVGLTSVNSLKKWLEGK